MSQLDEVQSFFATAVQSRTSLLVGPDANRTRAVILGNARLSPQSQLEIYREQFWMRHVGALVEDYQTVHHLLGHDGFDVLCKEYLAAFPPKDFSLRDLGARLPAFLEERAPYRDDRLLLDCARVEWAFVEAFDAAEAPPLDASAIAAISEDAWTSLRLQLHPSVQRVALAHPAHELRARVRDGEDAPRPDTSPTYVIVYRGPDALQYIAIEPLAFELLGRLAAGTALGAACDELAETPALAEELELKIGGWFQAWTAMGWIGSITV